jgi:hypothetical protein
MKMISPHNLFLGRCPAIFVLGIRQDLQHIILNMV